MFIKQTVKTEGLLRNGANCSAALYSIVATAQANELDAERFLTELFLQPAGTIILPFDA